MKNIFRLLPALFLVLGYGCRKDNTFRSEIVIMDIIAFPDNKATVTFSLQNTGAKKRPEIIWTVPTDLWGAGPFTLELQNDMYLEAQIRSGGKKNIATKYIFWDDIDKVKYDYRKKYFGRYDCRFEIRKYSVDGSTTETGRDTVEITAADDFGSIWCSHFPGNVGVLNIAAETFTFFNMAAGRFRNDSIRIFQTSGTHITETKTHWGKKIQ